MKIKLQNGGHALLDKEDFRLLSKFKWRKNGRYVSTCHKGKTTYLHLAILWRPNGMVIDHINGNTKDNRRKNLRVCTQVENAQNKRRSSSYMSKYTGVSWNNGRNKWRSTIQHDGDVFHLGMFKKQTDAARAYDKAAKLLYGKHAKTNF